MEPLFSSNKKQILKSHNSSNKTTVKYHRNYDQYGITVYVDNTTGIILFYTREISSPKMLMNKRRSRIKLLGEISVTI